MCVQDMKETLRQELDFEQEARNGEQCQEDLRHLSYVYVPQILWNMTSKVRLPFEYDQQGKTFSLVKKGRRHHSNSLYIEAPIHLRENF